MFRAGRRQLYLYGVFHLGCLLLITACVDLAGNERAPWAVGALLILYTFVFDITVGPVCYSLVSDIPSIRLKSKTLVLARNTYNVMEIVNNIITPYMLNPTQLNWGRKMAYFWAGMCALCWLYAYFRLPEPKGKSFGQLDELFARGVKARDFSNVDINPFAASGVRVSSGSDMKESLEQVEDKD